MDHHELMTTIGERFSGFGPNKIREIHRLCLEIIRREGVPPESLWADLSPEAAFAFVKARLVERRYPELTRRGIRVQETFPAFDVDPRYRLEDDAPRPFAPQVIAIERGEEDSPVARRFLEVFPQARREVVEDIRLLARQGRSGADYNRRCETVLIVRERYDFFKACPCSPGVVGCGYHNANLGMGCPYECSYCFLQSYTNARGIMFPSNIEDFFAAFCGYTQGIRVGSGEMTDSLVFDHITRFSPKIVEAFRRHPQSLFEFKTKSANVDLLLTVPASSNIVVAWSVNPPRIVSSEERGAAPLAARLQAAGRCAAHGYRTGFHFDPIIHYDGWEKDYAGVVEKIFASVPPESIAWISLGTLRMTKEHKKMIENRFPGTTILNAELLTAPDGKIRYHQTLRQEIYRIMQALIRGHSAKTPVYLCMETPDMWRSLDMTWTWH